MSEIANRQLIVPNEVSLRYALLNLANILLQGKANASPERFFDPGKLSG
jgi:hypothetical protein